jgi:hypothetical protein
VDPYHRLYGYAGLHVIDDLPDRTLLDDDGGDDQTGFRHRRSVSRSPGCLETSVRQVLNQDTSAATS